MRFAPWPPTAWEQKLSNPCAALTDDKRSALCEAPKETYDLLYRRTPACATTEVALLENGAGIVVRLIHNHQTILNQRIIDFSGEYL